MILQMGIVSFWDFSSLKLRWSAAAMHEQPSLHLLFTGLEWDPGLQTDAMYVSMRLGRSFGPLAEEIISAGARLITHDSAQKASGITTVRKQHKQSLLAPEEHQGSTFSSPLAAPLPYFQLSS